MTIWPLLPWLIPTMTMTLPHHNCSLLILLPTMTLWLLLPWLFPGMTDPYYDCLLYHDCSLRLGLLLTWMFPTMTVLYGDSSLPWLLTTVTASYHDCSLWWQFPTMTTHYCEYFLQWLFSMETVPSPLYDMSVCSLLTLATAVFRISCRFLIVHQVKMFIYLPQIP